MTVTCTIEARMGSTRLPGKALYCLGGKPIVDYVIESARDSGVADRVILCTTTLEIDNLLAHAAERLGVECFRGPENDVAGRIAGATRENSRVNIFLTGDNPFVTPDLIAQCYRQFEENEADYLCTTHMKYSDWWHVRPSLPTGLSVQIARTSFFQEMERKFASDDNIRQHSTMVMYKYKSDDIKYVAFEVSTRFADIGELGRFTIDTATDYINALSLIENIDVFNIDNILAAAGRLN